MTITLLDEAAEAETVKIASTSLNPAGVTNADIVGGVDAETAPRPASRWSAGFIPSSA